jgi:hypothetical protein
VTCTSGESSVKIVDTFMFWNEYDLLEIRLSEHYEHVDRFDIIECDHTYSGRYKGFNLESRLDRYSQWMDKINYIKVSDCPVFPNSWDNEAWQRNQMTRAWDDVGGDDVILLTDLDEIVRPEALKFIRETDYNFYGLAMPMFYFKFNYMDITDNYPWRGLAYRGYKGVPNDMRFKADSMPKGKSIELHHAGWHFSWLGNDEFVKEKLKSFSHTELNIPSVVDNVNIEQSIARGRDHFRPNEVWGAVKLDDYFPKTIRNNQEKYKDYIVQNGTKSVQDYWRGKILEERK